MSVISEIGEQGYKAMEATAKDEFGRRLTEATRPESLMVAAAFANAVAGPDTVPHDQQSREAPAARVPVAVPSESIDFRLGVSDALRRIF